MAPDTSPVGHTAGETTATSGQTYSDPLPAMLEPARGTTGRHCAGYASPPPARENALVVLDHRSRAEQLGEDDDPAPVSSLLGTLHSLGLYAREQLQHPRPRTGTLSSEIGYLIAHLDPAGHPWIADVAGDIRQLHTQARARPTAAAARHLPFGRLPRRRVSDHTASRRGAV